MITLKLSFHERIILKPHQENKIIQIWFVNAHTKKFKEEIGSPKQVRKVSQVLGDCYI